MVIGRDRLHGLPGEFTVVKCLGCGLMRTNPRPTPETIGYYYPPEYGPYQKGKVNAVNRRYPPARWKRLIERLLDLRTHAMPTLPPGRLLEVGCATGGFLQEMAMRGWLVEGVEASTRAAAVSQSLGYVIHTGHVEKMPDPPHFYNLIVGWMLFEHLHDPMVALKKFYRWTAPKAWLVLSVPNAGSFEFRLFRETWYGTDLPRHLYHYTPQTIAQVLERGGWRMTRVLYQYLLSDTIGSLGYCLRDWGLMPDLAKRLVNFPSTAWRMHYVFYPVAFLLAAMGQTGRMVVWAQRAA